MQIQGYYTVDLGKNRDEKQMNKIIMAAWNDSCLGFINFFRLDLVTNF